MLHNLLPSASVGGESETEIWLFGSARASETPRDIDVLIVYDATVVPIAQAIELRERLAKLIAAQAKVPADIVLLSRHEVAETQFIKRIQPIRLV